LAHNNYATRKAADDLIKKGLVLINGSKAILGDQVNEQDKVTVLFKTPKDQNVYYAYNKPVGISTNKDSEAKDILETTKFPNKVFPIGRLDKDSHGLIIMTNDGRVTDRLLSPMYIHEKEYVVKVEPNISDKFLELIQNGVHFDKFLSKKCSAWRSGNKKNTFHIILTEGKKRQIRRMCEALHHQVIDLKRIRVMNIELGQIKDGEYKEIKGKELNDFLKLLKLI
jgi:23S rRNA pseudouridine2604 synthase